MAVELSSKMQEFVKEVFPAFIGTARKDGSVEQVPVWFEYRDGSFWINGGTNRGWVKHLERDPRIQRRAPVAPSQPSVPYRSPLREDCRR